MSTISISRAERDLIRVTAGYWMYTDDAVAFDDRAQATATIRKLQRLRTFYDELGWEEEDPRQTFVTTADEGLLEVVREAHEHAVESVKSETHYRETHIVNPPHPKYGTTWSDDFPTIEQANAAVDSAIQKAEDQQRVSAALLARLDAEAVMA